MLRELLRKQTVFFCTGTGRRNARINRALEEGAIATRSWQARIVRSFDFSRLPMVSRAEYYSVYTYVLDRLRTYAHSRSLGQQPITAKIQ